MGRRDGRSEPRLSHFTEINFVRRSWNRFSSEGTYVAFIMIKRNVYLYLPPHELFRTFAYDDHVPVNICLSMLIIDQNFVLQNVRRQKTRCKIFP